LHPGLPDSSVLRWIMGILAFGCAMVLAALVVLLEKRLRVAYFPMLGLLILLTVLTITDDAGLALSGPRDNAAHSYDQGPILVFDEKTIGGSSAGPAPGICIDRESIG
jgi:hypothetical protein